MTTPLHGESEYSHMKFVFAAYDCSNSCLNIRVFSRLLIFQGFILGD